MTKISVCCSLYFRNPTSYNLHLWYTCMCKRIRSPGIFLSFFFLILVFGIIRKEGEGVVKGQRMAQNEKKFCLSVCLTPYHRNRASYDCDFLYTCKMMISPANFSFFKILIFGVFSGIKG